MLQGGQGLRSDYDDVGVWVIAIEAWLGDEMGLDGCGGMGSCGAFWWRATLFMLVFGC